MYSDGTRIQLHRFSEHTKALEKLLLRTVHF